MYIDSVCLYNGCTPTAFLNSPERAFLRAASRLAFCNPFLPERVQHERAALGAEFADDEPVWSFSVHEPERRRTNVWRIAARLDELCPRLRAKLTERVTVNAEDRELYEDGVLNLLYQRYYPRFFDAAFGEQKGAGAARWRFYSQFLADWRYFFDVDGLTLPLGYDPSHTFACYRQIQCAFERIFQNIIGNSLPAARLRAAVWESIFTHDMRRYRRTLYERMGEFATLITGPSGSGKELVARAIAESPYLRFDERRMTFPDDDAALFFPINISALSPTLVESELFGHRRGAFTGAVADRKGWLETCPPRGSVFLDELGDLDPAIQVKLLRVIETRRFAPVGDTASLRFQGKLIAATNRDLAADIQARRFREDLYFRLCSDLIATPSLAQQIADSPRVLAESVAHMARKIAGAESQELAVETVAWVEQNLGREYGWPGNYRELEQCVRNVLIRRNYRPPQADSGDPAGELASELRAGRLTADRLLRRYCTYVYRLTGSYEETARRLQLDRRTVKAKVD
ncbi:MAG TPA: sigma 54-interacting transcriptional regulator [Bryobacteraceae bacterium]|jgi:transcriptional regulator with AAA-type ATPase domain|nr:sigma 54-interacting transcriptional regulator [Bryobacteraceae bacterium]